MKFDAATFSIPAGRPILGNSEHPVYELVKHDLRRIPGKPGMYYTVTKTGVVVTYREADRTFAYTEFDLDTFKINLAHGGPWSVSADNMSTCEEREKHLGNALMRLINVNV